MPLSKAHHALLKSLIKEHASNKVVRRVVRKGVKAFKKYAPRALSYAQQTYAPQFTPFIKAVSGHGDYGMSKRPGTKYGAHIHDRGSMGARHDTHRKILREKGEMTICHSEYIGELITGSTVFGTGSAFTSQAYGINPGNAGTFPWLSTVANNFQDYQFEKLVFEFRSLVSESTSTTSGALQPMGSVIAATQYDSNSGVYPNKAQMENSDFAKSCKPSEHLMHAIECKSSMNPLGTLYIASTQNLSNTSSNGGITSDIRFQNLGIVQFASVGCPIVSGTALDLGELWVHYDVKLLKPQLNGYLSALQSAHYIHNPGVSGNYVGAFGRTYATVPGNGSFPSPVTNNALSLGFINGGEINTTTGVITFSQSGYGLMQFPLGITEGSFLCVFSYNAVNSLTNITSVIFSGYQLTVLQVWENNGATGVSDSQNFISSPFGASAANSQTFITACIVSINAPGASLATLQLYTSPILQDSSGLITYDVVVTPYNSIMLD